MNTSTPNTAATFWQKALPIAFLIFISPVLTELLMGVVHITNIWLLGPEMGVYGVGALLIREVVRRQKRGWGTILALGVAFAIAEECIILQTSFTPQFFQTPASVSLGGFGWALGVQWNYLLAMLGYESVFAIVLPIYLTEILFPEQRDEPWLSDRGFWVALVVFVLASIGVYFLWSLGGVTRYGNSGYQIPLVNIGLGVLAMVALVAVTLLWPLRGTSAKPATRKAWSPWLVGPIAFVFAFFWWILVVFAYLDASLLPGFSPLIPIGFGLAWAGVALLVIRYLSTAGNWGDRQRMAIIFGASLASMLGGVLTIIVAEPIDQIGKLVFDLIAIGFFIYWSWRLGQQAQAHSAQG